MNKPAALYEFWSQFGIPAFDEQTVPTGDVSPALPYITYESATDSFGGQLALTASVWDRSSSWQTVEAKAEEISRAINEHGYWIKQYPDGYLLIYARRPFAQRMSDPDDSMVRRIVISITAEFLSAY